MQHSQGDNRVIAGETQRGAIGQALEGKLEERSIGDGRRVLEHPPRRILSEQEARTGTEDHLSGMQGGEIAGVTVRSSREPLEKPEWRHGRSATFRPVERGPDRGQFLEDDQASRFRLAHREDREPRGVIVKQVGRMKRPIVRRMQV